MVEILAHWFAAVCGQDPGHTWAPGGVMLPCCQRCLGLYMGSGLAALLHLWLRPRLTGRFLEVHGAFLLLMVPFGFHWVTQGAVLRTVTGVLFGFGVVTFLWLPLSQWAGERAGKSEVRSPKSEVRSPKSEVRSPKSEVRAPKPEIRHEAIYFLGLGAMLMLLPATARLGGAGAGYMLAALAFCGAMALAGLVVGNLRLGLLGAFRLLRRLVRPGLQT